MGLGGSFIDCCCCDCLVSSSSSLDASITFAKDDKDEAEVGGRVENPLSPLPDVFGSDVCGGGGVGDSDGDEEYASGDEASDIWSDLLMDSLDLPIDREEDDDNDLKGAR